MRSATTSAEPSGDSVTNALVSGAESVGHCEPGGVIFVCSLWRTPRSKGTRFHQRCGASSKIYGELENVVRSVPCAAPKRPSDRSSESATCWPLPRIGAACGRDQPRDRIPRVYVSLTRSIQQPLTLWRE